MATAPSLRDLTRRYETAVSAFLTDYEAAREAQLALQAASGLSRVALSIQMGDHVPGAEAEMDRILAARLTRQPLAQILGFAMFRDRKFRVTEDVLCPRADTEILVDLALEAPFERVLDLGTGPGTIALTLLAERPEAEATATDLSKEALAVAKDNAAAFDVLDRLTLCRSDWWTQVEGRFDLIVSNPPYVDIETYAGLQPEITRWEPRMALTPGGDGLAAYRAIAAGLAAHLEPGGRLLLEIGFDQGDAVLALMSCTGLEDLRVHPDLNGHPRVVSGTMPMGHGTRNLG